MFIIQRTTTALYCTLNWFYTCTIHRIPPVPRLTSSHEYHPIDGRSTVSKTSSRWWLLALQSFTQIKELCLRHWL